MSAINVNRNVSDRFYRYKMPSLIAKVEGKGNGIKTVIVNMTEIGRCLARPPTYLTKYFGCEFGAQTKCDIKNDRFVVNGAHEGIKLQDALDGFIKKFVLCSECNNPETEFHINTKKQTILISCKACGFVGNVDPNHRLSAFILKNPIDDNTNEEGKKVKNGKKIKKGEKGDENCKNGAKGSQQSEEIPNFGGLVLADQNDSLDLANMPPPSSAKSNQIDDDDDWGDDDQNTTSNDLSKKMSKLTQRDSLDADLGDSQQERINKFYHFVQDLKKSGSLTQPGMDKKLLAEAEDLDIKDKAPLVLAELLFTQNLLSEIAKYRTIFLRFCGGNPKAQKYLLGAFEQLVGKEFRTELLPKVPHILKAFYDSDILEEQVIIDWEGKISKKYVDKETAQEIRKKASPFITWLKEAEVESDDEGDEEDEGQVEGTTSDDEGSDGDGKPPAHFLRGGDTLGTAKVDQATGKQKDGDSDLDIDAI